jgi:APA family basic amino acid/polyamine antiporter
MLGCTRGFYALAARGDGIAPDPLGQVDKKTNMPHNSATLALFICVLWLAYFVGSQFFGWFGEFAFDSSELPIITAYPIYVPILIGFMIKKREVGVFKRFVLPILSILGAGVMVAAGIYRHGKDVIFYLIIFVLIMLTGAIPLLVKKAKWTPTKL